MKLFTTSVIVFPLLGLLGCSPQRIIRIDQESSPARRCVDYKIPEPTSYLPEEVPDPGDPALDFVIRANATGDTILVRAKEQWSGRGTHFGAEAYFLRRDGASRASESDWKAAAPVVLHREHVAELADGASLTLLSPHKVHLLRIRHMQQYGILRPSASVLFEILDVPSKRILWTAKAAAPYLPPVEELERIAWLDEKSVIMAHNRIGTQLTVCWSVGDDKLP